MAERRAVDVNAGPIAAAVALLGVVVVACAVAVYALARAWDAPLAGSSGAAPVAVAGPRLQSAPQADRDAYVAEKERVLGDYAWIDRKRGLARIPIDEAMKLVAAGVRPAREERR